MKHWLLLGTALLLGGCSAYQAGGPKPAFRSLEIAPVRNATSRTGTHAVLHSKLTDAFAGDPLRGMALDTACFARIGAALARLDLPTVLVQEGGYLAPELGDNLASALGGFLGAA